MPATLRCPICKKEVSFDGPEMPFCSKRCRMIDLGNWAEGRYVVSTPTSHEESEDESEEHKGPTQ